MLTVDRCRLWVGVALILLVGASGARAADLPSCGTSTAGSGGLVEGQLKFDASDSVVDLAFKAKDGSDLLAVQYDVMGCRLDDTAGLAVRVNPPRDLRSAMPRGLTVSGAPGKDEAGVEGGVHLIAKDTILRVEIPVKAGEFAPGSYRLSVTLSGRPISEANAQLTTSRKEPFVPWLLLLVLVTFIVGVAWVGFLAYDRARAEVEGEIRFKVAKAGTGLVAAAGAAYAALQSGYVKVDAWAGDLWDYVALGVALLTAVAGAATVAAFGGAFVAAQKRRTTKKAVDRRRHATGDDPRHEPEADPDQTPPDAG